MTGRVHRKAPFDASIACHPQLQSHCNELLLLGSEHLRIIGGRGAEVIGEGTKMVCTNTALERGQYSLSDGDALQSHSPPQTPLAVPSPRRALPEGLESARALAAATDAAARCARHGSAPECLQCNRDWG